jgi:hypothetical protein
MLFLPFRYGITLLKKIDVRFTHFEKLLKIHETRILGILRSLEMVTIPGDFLNLLKTLLFFQIPEIS